MTGEGVTAVVEGEALELELTRVADGAQLHATRTKARIARGRLIVVGSNGPHSQLVARVKVAGS
jgi:hypothetical protein